MTSQFLGSFFEYLIRDFLVYYVINFWVSTIGNLTVCNVLICFEVFDKIEVQEAVCQDFAKVFRYDFIV